MSDLQAATHLKGLADKAKLNEKHVKIARIYKAKVASLTSERAGLQERAQHMTEEIERLKSDLKHSFFLSTSPPPPPPPPPPPRLFFLLGMRPDTCVTLLSINIYFSEICVLAEISLFFSSNCIT